MTECKNLFMPKILYKKLKSIPCNVNGIETNLPFTSYLSECELDKRKAEEQVAKETKANNKIL